MRKAEDGFQTDERVRKKKEYTGEAGMQLCMPDSPNVPAVAVTEELIGRFTEDLRMRERAENTIEKYAGELRRLTEFLKGELLDKRRILEYREALLKQYRTRTVNGKISAVNAYVGFMGKPELKAGLLRIQRPAFVPGDRELTRSEYQRLLDTAKRTGNDRLHYLQMTLGGTGIRISELPYITVEAAREGRAEIRMKGKTRVVLIPPELGRKLLAYSRRRGICSGTIFLTRSGRPMDRSNIWHEMKRLCRIAGVSEKKVFPHNFRHLFARTFYHIKKDLAHLADVLGHSSIETTRIYVAESMRACGDVMRKMALVT